MPVTITAWAYSWVSHDPVLQSPVYVQALSPNDFYNRHARRLFMLPLLAVLEQADVVTGHNIIRADLPWVNGECMELGLPTLAPLLVQDTIKLGKARVKKGQDVLSDLLGVKAEKLPLNWSQWQAAYAEPSLQTVKDRVAGDVRQHMQMRQKMREAGWLRAPKMWSP